MGSTKTIADVFPAWLCVNTHLNVSDQQTDKTSVFIKIFTLAGGHFAGVKCIWLAVSDCQLSS